MGPQRAESIWPHTRCRVDTQPVNSPPSIGELAAIAIIVGPSACASRTRAAHPSRGPASTLTWIDAVDVIIAAPASPERLAREELLHGAIARARVDALRWPQRIRPEENQAQPGVGEGRPQHGLVAIHRVDGGHHSVGGRAGQFDGAAGFHGDRAAAGQRGEMLENLGDFVPAGPAVRVGRVVAVRLQLQADTPQRAIEQAALGDVLRGGGGVGQFGFGRR